MDTKSLWRQFKKPFSYPVLYGPAEADVVILGGGLTGIIAAYLLKDSGLSIAVIEAEEVGYRASGSTTAFLMELLDTDAGELSHLYGERKAKQILDSHRDALSFYEDVSGKESIQCEFARTPLYAYAHTRKEARSLRDETEVLVRLGRLAQWRKDDALLLRNEGYMVLPDQAKLHPLKFLFGLTKRVCESGVAVFEHTRVAVPDIKAKWILAATHFPPSPQPLRLYFKKAAYLTYVIETEFPPGTLPEGLFEDTQNPYHYMRVDRKEESDRVLVGGADHRMDIHLSDERAFRALRKYLEMILPQKPYRPVRQWKGMIVEPGDGLAFIGPVSASRTFYATGYSGNGLTYAVIAAQLFRDRVLGRRTGLADVYAADRPFNAAAHAQGAKRYLGEFFGGICEIFSA
jgi:glycine/D-amino acid oxidase-like deaminating enzyme